MNKSYALVFILTFLVSTIHADGYKAYFYGQGNWHKGEKLDIELQYTYCDSQSTTLRGDGRQDIPAAVITGSTYWGLPCCLHKIIIKEKGNQLYDHIVDRCSEVKFKVKFDDQHNIHVEW